MQAPMSTKFRKHLANPKNASKLTELVLLNEKSKGTFKIRVGKKSVNVRQLGIASK